MLTRTLEFLEFLEFQVLLLVSVYLSPPAPTHPYQSSSVSSASQQACAEARLMAEPLPSLPPSPPPSLHPPITRRMRVTANKSLPLPPPPLQAADGARVGVGRKVMQRDVCGRVLHISTQRRPSFQRCAVTAVKAVTVTCTFATSGVHVPT